MPIRVDPDLGYLEFEFTLPSDPLPDGTIPEDRKVTADIDVYHATELLTEVGSRYMHELEAAGRQEELSQLELTRRWLRLLFKPHGLPDATVNRWSYHTLRAIQSAIAAEVERLSKKGPGSSTPDSPGTTTGTPAGPTA